MTYTIYHNPNCSKSRKTLEILKTKVTDIRIVEYLKTPPDQNELRDIINKLNIKPKELIRFNDYKAKELRVSFEDDFSLEEWISILVNNPKLIERPIVVFEERGIIGRPPENVLKLF